MYQFNFNVAHNIEKLAQQFSHQLKNSTANIFQTTKIVTQTKGMNIWLAEKMADELGVFINYEFCYAQHLIHQIFKQLGGQPGYILNQTQITWQLFALMEQEEFITLFPKVAQYYSGNEQKRLSLATKISDLFDKYQVHRPDLIMAWNAGQLHPNYHSPHQDWQMFLWQKIRAHFTEKYFDQTEVVQYLFNVLKNQEAVEKLKAFVPEIHLFGLSTFTPPQIEVFYGLSQYILIHIYILNPAPQIYWIEDKSERQIQRTIARYRSNKEEVALRGNDLLTNWGQLVQNTLAIFYQKEEVLNHHQIVDEWEEVTFSNTLLSQLQYQIYHNLTSESLKIEEGDKSLQIASSYSIMREVEALYDYLVATINDIPEMTLRDILVIVNDIDVYGPYIRAVMDNAPVHLKYTIADEILAQQYSIIGALQALVDLNENNINAEYLIKLLENNYIAKSFEIEDLSFVRKAISFASIRFGLYNKKENDTYLVSIHEGLRRLMLGICIEGEQVFDETIPLDFTDSFQDFNTIVKLQNFVEQIENMLAQRGKKESLGYWKLHVEQILESFILLEQQDAEEHYQQIMFRLNQISQVKYSVNETNISFNTFADHLLSLLQDETQSKKYLNAGITFCSPIPFRSIPFKVVAILGLNYDSFPRKDKIIEFDLTTLKYQLGDRSIKLNDKHLFLESLLSAKDRLYLSYIGKSASENKSLSPSILIDELIEYINKRLIYADNILPYIFTQHPLHSFSKLYESTLKNKPNYHMLKFNNKGILNFDQDSKKLDYIVVPSAITLNQLGLFVQNANEYYYRYVLDVHNRRMDKSVQNEESFDVDTALGFEINPYLVKSVLEKNEQIWQDKFEKIYKKGQLPLGNLKHRSRAKVEEEFEHLQSFFKKRAINEGQQLILSNAIVENVSINGIVQYIDEQQLNLVFQSRSHPKHLAKAYVIGLVASCFLGINNVNIYFKDKVVNGLQQFDHEESLIKLRAIIRLLKKQHEHLTVYSHHLFNAENETDYYKKMESAVTTGYHQQFIDDFLLFSKEFTKQEYEEGLIEEFDRWIGKQIGVYFKI